MKWKDERNELYRVLQAAFKLHITIITTKKDQLPSRIFCNILSRFYLFICIFVLLCYLQVSIRLPIVFSKIATQSKKIIYREINDFIPE